MKKGITALNPREFETVAEAEEALIIDTRPEQEFVKGFIPNSIFIGLDGSFASWVGTLIVDLKQAILFIAPEGREEEVVTRLARVGYDNTLGYLKGGITSWKAEGRELDTIEEVSAAALAEIVKKNNVKVLDVRRTSEFEAQHVKGFENFPLDFINKNMSAVNRENKYYLHCQSGYRSVVAASILRARGFENLVNVAGGFKQLIETDLPLTTFSEQNTEL